MISNSVNHNFFFSSFIYLFFYTNIIDLVSLYHNHPIQLPPLEVISSQRARSIPTFICLLPMLLSTRKIMVSPFEGAQLEMSSMPKI